MEEIEKTRTKITEIWNLSQLFESHTHTGIHITIEFPTFSISILVSLLGIPISFRTHSFAPHLSLFYAKTQNAIKTINHAIYSMTMVEKCIFRVYVHIILYSYRDTL